MGFFTAIALLWVFYFKRKSINNLQWFAYFCPRSLQSLFDPFTNPNGASASTGRRSFWGGSGGSGGGGGGSDGRG